MLRPPWLNPQCLLPALQVLALPLYWLIGGQLIGLGPVAATVFALATPFVGHVLVVAIGFFIAWLHREDRTARDAKTGLRRLPDPQLGQPRDWLIAYAREAAVSIRQFYWLMPFRAGFRIPEPAPPRPERPLLPPILLIHGYGCNRGLWLPAARWLSQRGYLVFALNLSPTRCSIDQYAPQIGRAIAALKAATGAAEVAIIGHSMGGLAARAFIRSCALEERDPGLAALITLGTPHRGTHLASVGQGLNARQMRFDSAWLEDLARHEAAAGGLTTQPALRSRVTTISGFQDNIVTRPLEQRLPGVRAVCVRRQGHMTLVSSDRILRLIDRLLVRSARRLSGDGQGATPPSYEPAPLPRPCRT